MNTADLLERVEPQWREGFVTFINTGTATDDFLRFLDSNAAAQEAVEKAFDRQAEAFEDFARVLADTSEAQDFGTDLGRVEVPAMVCAIEGLMSLPPPEQSEAVRKAGHALKASLSAEQKKLLKTVVSKELDAAFENIDDDSLVATP